ncbi:MAG TPA: PAS domain S-box protein, partial [Balneolaceae bacterium]|nr:PAS domain S-box protein [Balneolaceae bacterium]
MEQLLFDLNPNPVLIYELDTLCILKVNKAFLGKYGYEEDEISRLTIEEIRPKKDIEVLRKLLNQDEQSRRSGVIRHSSKSGEIFYVKVNSHSYSYEGKESRLAIIHDVTDRVEAEKKARRAFDELNHHVNHSPLAMVKWDADFRILKWSKRAEEIMGFKERSVLGKTPYVFRFNSDSDFAFVEEKMDLLISGKQDKVHFETRMNRKDGALIELRVHASVLRDTNGAIISVLTFIEDITQQKKTESRYLRLFENANDGIFIMEGDRFIECNEQVTQIYGCQKSDILGQTPSDFSPEYQPDGKPSRDEAQNRIEKALSGDPQVFEWKHLQKDGTPIDTEVSLNRLELGSEVYLQAIVRNLTEQKKARAELRKSEQLFKKLFLEAPGAIIMVDKQNRVKKVNQSFEKLFGYSKAELLDQDLDQIIVSKEDYQKVPKMPAMHGGDGNFYSDVIRYTKKGEAREVLLGTIPVYLDGEAIAGFGIYIDITKQKENERKLKNSLEEKQVLLEEIHHRVKNNLAIISGLLQLQTFDSQDEKIRSVLNDSQLRIQSMATVHELLYQSENFAEISFKTYVDKLVNSMKNTLPFDHQKIEVEIETAEILMDINQAIPCAMLINELITNAFKHAFKGRKSGTIRVTLKEIGKRLIIKVKDNGVGLPADFTIDKKKSIGMNLIQTLTQQLKGELNIKSKDGVCF